ncbi:MAG TPA: NADPH-dependent F420 reductase [Myxococcota bacterium]|nr:NADPH-dependent F420 reductase [Myxococcota bacterium]
MAKETVAILGGTGEQGLGLAYRFAAAGRPVRIGSRKEERALEAAKDVLAKLPGRDVSGHENAAAVRAARGGIVILSVPFEHTAGTVKAVRPELAPGTLLVSMGVPLAAAIGDVASRTIGVSQGSCAELVASLAPEGVPVVSAFQNVAAHRLLDLEHSVECDVIVSGEKEPRARVMALCDDVPGTRAIDGGPLYNARYVEQITALLIGINIRLKKPEGVGFRLTYL